MAAPTVFRQLLAVLIGTFAWCYYYNVEPFINYPQWVGIIIAAFIITLIVAIISENIMLGLVMITVVYVIYGPGMVWSVNHFIPPYAGVIAASAVWKII